jgi:(1->4)-alpha-D-glucan 1-alpha-D-glucosylmutase
MAKGVEDTALYRYLRLAALNEVGSDPGRWGASPAEVHARNAARARRFPRGLLATQPHDTKRSGDVRARIGGAVVDPGRMAPVGAVARAMSTT